MPAETTTDFAAEADQLIGTAFPSYEEPLKVAHRWVQIGGAALPAAVKLLRHLRCEHPYALKVGHELVLALLQSRDREAARAELEELETAFEIADDEETLCRFGRLCREVGDDYMKADPVSDLDRRLGLREYEASWEYYNRAFGSPMREGHYPGINRAVLFLLRAWATTNREQKKSLIDQSRQAAQELLDRRDAWPFDYPDDNIWHAATEADIHLLLGNYPTAADLYKKALAAPNATPFHRESIGGQVRRIIRPVKAIGNPPGHDLAGLEAIFAPPPKEPLP